MLSWYIFVRIDKCLDIEHYLYLQIYSIRQGYAVTERSRSVHFHGVYPESFDPSTEFILSVVEGLRAPFHSG